MKTKLDAFSIYLWQEFAASSFFGMAFTVNLVYQVQVAHLNPFQLVLVGTVLEATCFVCQVPTGVLADVYSRRLSIVVGYLLVGAGIALAGAVPSFAVILFAQVVAGVGYTFLTGAMEAWISDEIGPGRAGQAFLRGSQVGSVGGLLGIGVSAGAASFLLNLPILLAGLGLTFLSITLAIVMPERGFKPAARQQPGSWRHMAATFSNGLDLVRRRPVLITILAIAVFFGAFSEGFDRLWTPHLLQGFTLPPLGPFQPVIWFGVIRAGEAVLSMLSAEIARRRINTAEHLAVVRALLFSNSVVFSAVLLLGLAPNLAVALVALLAVSPARSTSGPLSNAWLNQSLEPEVRATVFSMTAQMDALGQISGGPVLGIIATAVSLRASLVVAALLLVPALWLYARSTRRAVASASPAPL